MTPAARITRDGPVEVGGRTVQLTHVDRVVFPDAGLTKGDVLAHYLAVAAVMLPHLRGRPLTLQRFPDGATGPGFYMKEVPAHFPDWIPRVSVPRRGHRDPIDQALVCDDPAALLYLANQGTLTFHVWPARSDQLDRPDLVVFDLDPPDGMPLTPVRAAARAVRDALRGRGLAPYLQTSGSKGYHVVAPIERGGPVAEVRAFAEEVAAEVAADDPATRTTEHRKARRGGRLYVDVARNGYAQTFVCPYSVRARPGAPVATPLRWEELSRAEPRSYTVTNLRRRLARTGDPWAGMARDRRPLPAAG